MLSRFIIVVCILSIGVKTCHAATVTIDVDFDRWMYPFNASPAARPSGSTFGAVGNPEFDDLDAQIIVGFDTAGAGIARGAGASNYQINSATVLLTTATDAAFVLDPTYDPYTTYLNDTTDQDPGRPVELYGVGFRNGYTSAGLETTMPGPPVFAEAEAYGPPGPPVPANGKRNAFASDHDAGSARDVSNRVRDGFDSSPWSIGDVGSLTAGQAVPIDTTLEFAIEISNANALGYLQSGLDQGALFFSVVSLHTSIQGSNQGIPSFHLGTLDGASLGQRAQLRLDYEIVPEPAGVCLFGLGLAIALRVRRRKSAG